MEGFVYSKVERFSEGDNINCQMTVFVDKTFEVTEETIREGLGDKLGDLEITNVIVVDTEKPTEEPTTGEKIVFKVTVTMPSEIYTEELGDSSSTEFKTLAATLKAILTKVLREQVSNFIRVKIISFRPGSIICIFDVITEETSTASEEEIKALLTVASNDEQTGNYTFTDITVEKEVTTKAQAGDQETTLPDWVIGVIVVLVIMAMLIFLMIYLVSVLHFKGTTI